MYPLVNVMHIAFNSSYTFLANLRITKSPWHNLTVRRVGGGGGGVRRVRIEPLLQVNDGGLKTQAVNFQLVANSGRMGNKL